MCKWVNDTDFSVHCSSPRSRIYSLAKMSWSPDSRKIRLAKYMAYVHVQLSCKVIRHLLWWQLLLRWYLWKQRVRMRVMIGFLVRGSVRIKIRVRVRVGVSVNVGVYCWSNCHWSKCRTFKYKFGSNALNAFLHALINQWKLILWFVLCTVYNCHLPNQLVCNLKIWLNVHEN